MSDPSFYKPDGVQYDLRFIFYIRGSGWIFGDARDFEAAIFDLLRRSRLAIVFPEYTLAPEKKHPVQIEHFIDVLQGVLGARKWQRFGS